MSKLLALLLSGLCALPLKAQTLHVHTQPALDAFLGVVAEADLAVLDQTWSVGALLWQYDLDFHALHLESSGAGARINKHFFGTATSSSVYMGGGVYAFRLGAKLFDHSIGKWGTVLGGSAGYQMVAGPLAIRLGGGYSPITPYVDISVGIVF